MQRTKTEVLALSQPARLNGTMSLTSVSWHGECSKQPVAQSHSTGDSGKRQTVDTCLGQLQQQSVHALSYLHVMRACKVLKAGIQRKRAIDSVLLSQNTAASSAARHLVMTQLPYAGQYST